MKLVPHADQCLSFLSCQLPPGSKRRFESSKLQPVVTISRQTGAGGTAIVKELSDYLQSHALDPSPWAVFDKNLVEQVIDEHKLPKDVAQYMGEDRVSAIQDAVEEMLGLHPSSRLLWQQTAETILHLAELGNVILIGRASHVITRHLPNAFHVRLVAPLEYRVQQVMRLRQLDHKTSLALIHKQDLGRNHYLKDHFHADIDDVLQYDLVINTSRMPHRVVAHLIGEAVLQWAKAL